MSLDEPVAMFFTLETIRATQAAEDVGILHGDIKSDYCLVRFELATRIDCPY